MIINDILDQLNTSSHPVAKAIHKGEHFKVLAIAFKKGMTLKEHKTTLPAILKVLSGSIIYHEGELNTELNQYEEIHIPECQIHSVSCLTDALCLSTQGK